MWWMKGFEPSASRATIWRANQLRHIHHLLGVPGGTRTPNLLLRRQLLYPAELQAHTFRKDCDGLTELEQVMGIEPTCSAWKADILPLNYTRMAFQQKILYHNKREKSIAQSKNSHID